jgi:competence protein ComEC
MGQVAARHKVRARIDWQRVWTAEGRRAILWLPVLMGAGIWLYFALDREPNPLWCELTALPVMALAGGLARRAGLATMALALALAAFGAGFSLALLAAHRAEAPMLSGPVEETIEGRVLALSKAASGAPRVLLDRVVIYGFDPRETPRRVRVTLLAAEHGEGVMLRRGG